MTAPHPTQDSASIPQISFDPTPFLNQLVWKVNTTTGNNNNDGLTDATAIKNMSEIRRRWSGGIKGVRPQLPAIDVVTTVTGDAADFTDPVSTICDIDAAPGFTMLVDFVPTVKRSGAITTVPNPFARTTTGQQTVTDAGVANWTPDVDQPLRDNTTGAWTWVVAGGATATLAASRASPLTTAAAQRALVNAGLGAAAVAAGNAYDILTLATCYFGTGAKFRLSPGTTDASASGLAVITIRRTHGLAQSAQDECQYEGTASFTNANAAGAAIQFVECSCDQPRRQYGGVSWLNCAAPQNTADLMGGEVGSSAAFLAGYARHNVFLADGGQLDQDFAILGSFSINTSRFTSGSGDVILGNVGRFLMGGADLTAMFHQVGQCTIQADFDAQGVFYGTTGIRAIVTVGFNQVGGCVLQAQETAANAFNFNGGTAAFFNMGGGQVGVAFDTAAGAFVAGNRNLSVANLDATVGAGGFGQHALWPATQCAILVHA